MFSKKSLEINSDSLNLLKKLTVIFLFLGAAFLLYNVANIISVLFLALFLNILFSPFLNYLNKKKIGDFVGIIMIYFFIILFIIIVFFAIIPIFVKQIGVFSNSVQSWVISVKTIYEQKGIDGLKLPYYVKFFLNHIDIKEALDSIKNNAADIGKFFAGNLKNFISNGAGIITSFTSAIFNFILVFIFSFFIALERKNIREFFYKIIPEKYSKYILSKEHLIIINLSNWLKGQMILGASIFSLTLIGLITLRLFGVHIKEYFSLALIAGMMEFIPYIGPFLAIIPALAIAAGLGSKAFLIVIVLYIIIQQTENNILVPYVMGKALELSPFAVLLAMMIGASMFGIIGIIIAIPVVSIIQIFLADYLKSKK